eukprot:354859-Chlamydomonas_euryale.AAC.5
MFTCGCECVGTGSTSLHVAAGEGAGDRNCDTEMRPLASRIGASQTVLDECLRLCDLPLPCPATSQIVSAML